MIRTVNIIGAGNVGSYLYLRLKDRIEIRTIFSRNLKTTEDLVDNKSNTLCTKQLKDLKTADLNIVCVKDDAILDVVNQLDRTVPVVHTSGSMEIDVLANFERNGIIYPLQSLTKGQFHEELKVPILYETSSNFKKELLSFIELNLFKEPILVDSEKRKKIHLSAVFTNNFTNYLLHISKTILDDIDVNHEILKPLAEETIKKAFLSSPEDVQTGPAVRNDRETIDKHLKLLNDENYKAIYELISTSIKNEFKS